jgi:hypothetical protein
MKFFIHQFISNNEKNKRQQQQTWNYDSCDKSFKVEIEINYIHW